MLPAQVAFLRAITTTAAEPNTLARANPSSNQSTVDALLKFKSLHSNKVCQAMYKRCVVYLVDLHESVQDHVPKYIHVASNGYEPKGPAPSEDSIRSMEGVCHVVNT